MSELTLFYNRARVGQESPKIAVLKNVSRSVAGCRKSLLCRTPSETLIFQGKRLAADLCKTSADLCKTSAEIDRFETPLYNITPAALSFKRRRREKSRESELGITYVNMYVCR